MIGRIQVIEAYVFLVRVRVIDYLIGFKLGHDQHALIDLGGQPITSFELPLQASPAVGGQVNATADGVVSSE